LIVTFHGFDATVKTEYAAKSFFGHRTYSRNKLTLGARAHCLIAVSKFIRNCLVDQGFHKDRIVIHYIGVDTDFFTPSQRIPRSKQVLYVGRLVEKKGPTLFIESIARLQAESPDVNAVMIGDGHLRSQIVALAQERRCQVRLLGSQPPQVVRDWMNRSRVLCFPSITAPSGDAEGFGLVLAEAQSMGLPVVAFASGGVPEAVIDRTSGLLFPEGDVQGLTHGLREMINRDDLFASMAQAGRENALKNFNLATQSRLLEDVYLRVIDDFAS
jgi:glycosyltransferase involved in cell wall biosynthesis